MYAGFPQIQINIAQYHYESAGMAKRKLSQFPARTSFLLQGIPPDSTETRSTVAEIETFLAQRGMQVEIRKTQ